MNNHISGQIVREDNEKGIPNLIVAAFDIDTAYSNLKVTDDKTLNDLLKESWSSRADASPQAIRNILEIIWGPVDEEDIVLRGDAPAGDRLGSVLTDAKGRFSLKFEDAAYHDDEKERRPDILLAVFGPDITTDIGGGSFGLGRPELHRVVHLALFPRWNAGRQEAFYIKVPQSLFSLAGIPEETIHQQFDQDALFGFLGSEQGRARRERRAAAARTIPFALLPANLTGNDQYISTALPAIEADDRMRTTIVDGITAVGALDIAIPPIVWLTEDERETLGSTRTVSACDVLDLKGLGTEYARIRSLLTRQSAREQVSELDGPSTPSEGDSDLGDGEESGIDTSEPMASVTSRILGQIDSLPSISQTGSADILDDLQKIKDRINMLEMSGGPANVTAFRDFHSLQLAFKDVWTAALDSTLEADVLALYEEINAVNDEYPDALPRPDDLEDLRDFENFVLSISQDLSDELSIAVDVPSAYVQYFSHEEWNRLTRRQRRRFSDGYNSILEEFIELSVKEYRIRLFADALKGESRDNPNPLGRFQRLIFDIGQRLSEPYSFKYYAEGSVNYGILITYRQEWQPLNYQVGRLVSTLPLAPGETRELKITQKHSRTRAEKEMRKSLAENTYEQSSSIKSELDVLAKLATDTNFKMTASGSFTLGIGSIESTSEFSHNQKAESNRQHKQMSEATRKASEKVRQEREISVESKETLDSSIESNQKIHNPNNEVSVTYLMYELERRYRVHQRLERVTPTIMVAMDMPSPDELTEGWVLEHAWILRRVLLDDAFEDAIFLIESGRQSEALDVQIKRATYERESEALNSLNADFDAVIRDRANLRNQIINFQKSRDDFEAGERSTEDKVKDFFLSGGLSLFGRSDPGPDQIKLYEAMIAEAEARLKHVDEKAEELATAQRAAKREAREAGEQYSNVLKSVAEKDTQVKQLLMHIRQNIFHYMHAIWEMKHPDEGFFELAEKQVFHIPAGTVTCELRPADPAPTVMPGTAREGEAFEMICDAPVAPAAEDIVKVSLGSIAHVDQLLGFKGNYAVFPLKECSHLTDYMMREFVDDYFGVKDPALELGTTSADLLAFAKAVWDDESVDQDIISELILRSLSSPVPDTQEIILPTGQIYMEALKGDQALLEDFKLAHRGMDVLKVEEEIRNARLENLRIAARMVKSEPDFEDANIDKQVNITGGDGVIIESE